MPPLYRTQEEKRALESRNGALQFLQVLYEIDEWISHKSNLTPDLLKRLQHRAIVNLYSCAGEFRNGSVRIDGGEGHQPPDHSLVGQLVDELCVYVNENWNSCTPLHLGAYTLWRLNWIHPFFGGNGRTSRAAAYIVLCAKLGFRLPGEVTIADFIVAARQPYLDALRSADKAWEQGTIDLTKMEELLESLLAKQFLTVITEASGRSPI